MESWNALKNKLRTLFRRGALERDLEAEIRFHQEMSAQRESSPGAARRRFGNATLAREDARAAWTFHLLETFWNDLRYGARMMGRSKAFAAAAVLSLALGAGANTAMFSMLLAVCFPAFPYRDATAVLYLEAATPSDRWAWQTSLADFQDWRSQSRTVESMTAAAEGLFHSTDGEGAPERLIGLRVTPNFFSFLGVPLAAGREFRADENQPGREKVAVLGYGYWERRFDRRDSVIGQTIRLNHESYTVIGIVPQWFRWLRWRNTGCGDPTGESHHCLDVYVPLVEQPASRAARNMHVLGRAFPGLGPQQVQAELRSIASQLEREHPDTNRNWSVTVQPVTTAFFQMAPGLVALQTAAFFVLLIACTNVASLLLARAAVRRREMALRSALGAGRGRVVRQLLTEGLLLAALASALGVLFGWWGGRLAARSVEMNWTPDLLDWRLLMFAAGSGVLTALLFTLAPAFESAKADPGEALKEGGRAGLGLGRRRLRRWLVAGEVALALVLLVSATLMVQSYRNLSGVSPGFDPHPMLMVRLPAEDGAEAPPLQRMLESVRAVPGVASAALASSPHLHGGERVRALLKNGDLSERVVRYRAVTADYLATLNVRVRSGRDFDSSDRGARVALVNEPLAALLWPGVEPAGRIVTIERNGQRSELRVVGVMPALVDGHVRDPLRPQVLELSETPAASPWLVVRTHGTPSQIVPDLRKAVQAVDRTQPLAGLQTFDELLSLQVGEWRASRNLLFAFAAVALLLAALGVYGMLSYFVAQRRQEMGVRMALGARADDIFRVMLKDGLKLGAAGVAGGVLAAAGLTRALQGVLFGISPLDPPSFAAATLLLLLVTLFAAALPARRASRLEPSEALRYE